LAQQPLCVHNDGASGVWVLHLRLHLCKELYYKLDLCSRYQEWYVSGTAGTSGYTPLHFAARAGHCAAVQMLLDAGGDHYVVSQDLVSCYGAHRSSLTRRRPKPSHGGRRRYQPAPRRLYGP